VTPPIPRWLRAALASAVLVAAVTAVIALLEPGVPALGLGVLYLLAVVPIALLYGGAAASAVAVASMAAFSYFFLPPRYSLDPGTSERWAVLVAFLVASLVVGQLAARAQREARRSARLADEQAALQRVATLVARGVPPPEVFAAVAREVALLLGVDATHMGRFEPDATATVVGAWSRTGEHVPIGTRVELGGESIAGVVFRTGRPARIHDYEHASGPTAALSRRLGMRSAVGAPIIVDQRLWGVMNASTKQDRPLPADAESRISAFTELVAMAISNTEARVQTERLADEQAALRRVATLVARGVAPGEVFAAVAEEVGRLLPVDFAVMGRYDTDDTVTVIAAWGPSAVGFPVGSRWPLEGDNLARSVLETGRPARIDDYADASGELGHTVRESGVRSSVAAPITFEGRVWAGIAVASSAEQPLPLDTESRLENFAELVATAMSNAHARAEVRRLAEEQAALRRVATLVARESPSGEVFAGVAEEVGRLLGVEGATLYRYEPDGTACAVASWGEREVPIVVGTRMSVEGENVTGLVLRTGRAARIDDYAEATGALGAHVRELGFRSAVGCPVVVSDGLWGALVVGSRRPEPLPAETESRIGEFSKLVATAISNVQARSELAASRARIVAATDEERRRVVRDLHDGAQQRLVHTIITLQLARQALEQEQEAAPALVGDALHHAERANVELRELARGILPTVLTRGGLRAGVDELASRMTVPVETDVSVGRLPGAVEATAYFLVAEALTNVAKHARAERAEVSARIEDGTLAVQVRDDGVGGARADGSGLTGLADRLAALDGRLRVESPADGGTLVAAAIPLTG
jgi:GAF domain-containing protein